MKQKIHRCFGALLCALLLLAQLLPCFAAAAAPVLPHVDIRGFMNAAIYADQNDPTSEQLWPLDVRRILNAAGRCIPSLTEFAVKKDYEKLTESIVPYVNELFRPLMCDENGRPRVETSGAYLYYPTYEEVLASPELSFTYDWRLDPYESAARLDAFVRYLTDTLGFGQVVMECHSNGGVILLTYLAAYGTERVKSCCFSASAIYGAGFAGELMQGNLVIDETGLTAYLLSAFNNSERARLLSGLMQVLNKSGIFSTVSGFANDLIAHSHDFLFQKTVLPIFGNWLNIWAMVPDDQLAAGKAYIFDRLLAGDGRDHTAFIARVDAFTEDFRLHREEYLDRVNADCNLYVFCFYGYTGIPVTTDWTVMSDGVLMSKDSSFGASFCEPLSAEQFGAGAYVSPDGTVNGATARYPDQTWYFKNCRHALANDVLREMAHTLLYAESQATVETFDAYPQFLIYDGANRTIRADDGGLYLPLTFLQRVEIWLRNLFARLFRPNV